ncbi:MAG TPA: LysM domain-containing protein, partial [Thermodesulfobacteriota bacterium]|nr:LysM domain-containing protein [Thermodesulfobacteriota bacterium]
MKTRLLLIALCILFLAAYSGAEERVEESAHVPQEKGTVKIPDEENVYVIKKGDTLWHISEMFLKNPFKWPDLWKTNTYIVNPHLIYPGNTVKVLPTGIVVSGEKAKQAAIEAVPEGLPVEKLQKPEEQMQEVLVKVEEPALPQPP